MKKLVRYMQNQAVEYSGHKYSSVYLAPEGPEPQQRGQRGPSGGHTHGQIRDHVEKHPTSSAAAHVPGATGTNPIPNDLIKHQYAQDNILQSYEAYIPELPANSLSSAPKYWIIYLHGGYYRDPQVSATSFRHTLSNLASSPVYSRFRSSIAGYASINYRLSPHPDHPQDPTKTEDYELRNAKHPDHINDVLLGLAELQRKYHFGSNYLLIGHSVGATLAFQVALCQSTPWQPPPFDASPPTSTPSQTSTEPSSTTTTSVSPPLAILALAGIYSFPALHKSFPQYLSMTSNALGPSPTLHSAVSPASYPASVYTATWSRPTGHRRRIILLAHSPQDTMVDSAQVDVLLESLSDDGTAPRALSIATTINPDTLSEMPSSVASNFDIQKLRLKGDHDQVWEGGVEMAKAIATAIQAMRAAEKEHSGCGDVKDFGA